MYQQADQTFPLLWLLGLMVSKYLLKPLRAPSLHTSSYAKIYTHYSDVITSVSNHQPHGCLLNRVFRRRSKKTSKLRVTGLCEGNSLVTGEFPAQRASNADNVSIWWRHHGIEMETFSALLALCAGNSPVPMNSPHKGQLRGTLMFSLICAWINGWVNNREAGAVRRQLSRWLWSVVRTVTNHRWFPPSPSHAKLWCCLCYYHDHTVEQTVELLVIWDTMVQMHRRCNDLSDLTGSTVTISIQFAFRVYNVLR